MRSSSVSFAFLGCRRIPRIRNLYNSVENLVIRPLDPPRYESGILVERALSRSLIRSVMEELESMKNSSDNGRQRWETDVQGRPWLQSILGVDKDGEPVHYVQRLADLLAERLEQKVREAIDVGYPGTSAEDLVLFKASIQKFGSTGRPSLSLRRDNAAFVATVQLTAPLEYDGGALEVHGRRGSQMIENMEPEGGFPEEEIVSKRVERAVGIPPMRLKLAEGSMVVHRGLQYFRIAPVTAREKIMIHALFRPQQSPRR